MTNVRMYLQEDNGGRGLLLNINDLWYYNTCAPSGYFSGVDIVGNDLNVTEKTLINAIKDGEIDIEEVAENAAHGEAGWTYIEEYDKKSIIDIISEEIMKCGNDLISYGEIYKGKWAWAW